MGTALAAEGMQAIENTLRWGLNRLRKNSIRREAGFQPPHKANRIKAGFSPGGTLFAISHEIPSFSAARKAQSPPWPIS